MKGVLISAHPTAICGCLPSELNRGPGCPWSPFSCPQGWPQGVVGAVSFLLPIPSTSSLERWCLHSLSLQKWTKGFEGQPVLKPLEKKSSFRVWVPYSCPGQAFPCCSHPPWGKEGRRKIRLGLRSIDLPVFTWLREITSCCQSQKRKIHPLFFLCWSSRWWAMIGRGD